MAGIWFPEDNLAGTLTTPRIYAADNEAFNSSVSELHFVMTLILHESTATKSVPLLNVDGFATSNGSSVYRTDIWVENGVLHYRTERSSDGRVGTKGESTTLLPTGVPVEIVITMNASRSYTPDKLVMHINGTRDTVVNLQSSKNYTFPWYSYQEVSLGYASKTNTFAAGLLITDFHLSNIYNSSPVKNTSAISTYQTLWNSGFENVAEPLKVATRRNNIDSSLTWVNSDDTKVIRTDGNVIPTAGGGGGDAGAGGIIIPGNGNTTQVQGVITENDLFVARRVMAITEAQLAVTDSELTKHAVLASTVSSDVDGTYTLDTSPYEGAVMVIATDEYGTVWQPDTAYVVGDVIRPANFQGYVYQCTLAGTTGNTEPVWWYETDTSQTIGAAQFKAKPFSRPLVHGPIIPTIIPAS